MIIRIAFMLVPAVMAWTWAATAGLASAQAAAAGEPRATAPAAPAGATAAAALGVGFDADVRPLLQRYCFECHGPDKQEGGVGFDDVKPGTASLRARATWKRSNKQIAAGKMPPDDAKRPLAEADKKVLTGWMSAAVDSLDFSPKSRDPGPSLVRRLTRAEYDNTLRDLLGVPVNSGEEVGMPAEDVVDGFDNAAASLTLSPVLLEKYLAAADLALDKLFGPAEAVGGIEGAAGKAGRTPARSKAKGKDGKPAVDAIVLVRPGKDEPTEAAAKTVLTAFVRRAYRRPVRAGEVDRLLPLFAAAQSEGRSFDQCVRAAVKPVLVSPHFLYRVEQQRPIDDGRAGVEVGGHELAVRLSYFLWSTMPDAELSALADGGTLADPAVLDAQVVRMLIDPRARALTDGFAEQWLHLRRVETARPTTEFFPTFTSKLRRAMRDEAATFFDHLRLDDRPILDLIDADYTYVNADLAKHYGIAGVTGDVARRVELKPENHRGGLLGMGGVLALTSHTFRTSPTQRGKYVLEVLFGTPPPPPPPDVGQIQEDANKRKGKTGEVDTFRAQLARHASQKSCAGCHAKIDPLGFALDNYDPIGGWREATPDRPLDVSGTLPGGEAINGAAELKTLVMDRKDDFVRNLTEQVLSYAVGRRVDYFDECTVREVVDGLKRADYKFSALIRGVATSRTFTCRRPAGVR